MKAPRVLAGAILLLCCLGAAEQKDLLRRQVQASDAMGLWLQTEIMENEARLGQMPLTTQAPSPATKPVRLPYNEALKGAMQFIENGGAAVAEPGISQLSEDLLRQELTVLHQQNLQLYLRLNAQWDELAACGMGGSEVKNAKEVAVAVQRAVNSDNRVRTRPRGSLIDALKRSDEAAPDYSVASQAAAEGKRAQSLEPPVPGRPTAQDVAAAALNGQPLPDTFGVLSSVAPRNAQRPGSAPLDPVSPRSFPMPAFVPGAAPMEATPPGNPAVVTPPPESVAYLASLSGLSSAQATAVLQGRLTLRQAMQSRGQPGAGEDAGPLSASLVAPAANDPRWRPFYFGPRVQQWVGTLNTGSTFDPGGGQYDRADTRVNNQSDTRLNGELDQRVNTGNDRRMNQQNDPRVNY